MPELEFKLCHVYKDGNGDSVHITRIYPDGLYPIEGTILESDGKTVAYKRSYTKNGKNNHDMSSVRDLVPDSVASFTTILSEDDLLQKRIAEAVLLLYDNGFIVKKA
jgi:hypothetical protein